MTRVHQRRLNLILINLAAIVMWGFERGILKNDPLWLTTLPVILVGLNGIAFTANKFRKAAKRRSDSIPDL